MNPKPQNQFNYPVDGAYEEELHQHTDPEEQAMPADPSGLITSQEDGVALPDASETNPMVQFWSSSLVKQRVALDGLDPLMRERTQYAARRTADALVTEGMPAAVRLLAREIAARTVALDHADMVLAIFRERMRTDPFFDLSRLKAAELSATKEHNRLLNSIERYERLVRPVTPSVRVTGETNYVKVESGGAS